MKNYDEEEKTMSDKGNKAKTLKDIASELEPPAEDIKKPSKEELMNKLTLAIILSAIAPTKEQSEEAIKHAETLINLGLTRTEVDTCKKRALGRLQSGEDPLAGLDKAF